MYLLNKKNILLCGMLLASALQAKKESFLEHVQGTVEKASNKISEIVFTGFDNASAKGNSALDIVLEDGPFVVGGITGTATFFIIDQAIRSFMVFKVAKQLEESHPDWDLERCKKLAQHKVEKFFKNLSTLKWCAYYGTLAAAALVVWGIVWQVGDYYIKPIIEKRKLKKLLRKLELNEEINKFIENPNSEKFAQFCEQMNKVIPNFFPSNNLIRSKKGNIRILVRDKESHKVLPLQKSSSIITKAMTDSGFAGTTFENLINAEIRSGYINAKAHKAMIENLLKPAPEVDVAWGMEAIKKLQTEIAEEATVKMNTLDRIEKGYLKIAKTSHVETGGDITVKVSSPYSWESTDGNPLRYQLLGGAVTLVGGRVAQKYVSDKLAAIPGMIANKFMGGGLDAADLEKQKNERDQKFADLVFDLDVLEHNLQTLEESNLLKQLAKSDLQRELNQITTDLSKCEQILAKSKVAIEDSKRKEYRESILDLRQRVEQLAAMYGVKLLPMKPVQPQAQQFNLANVFKDIDEEFEH